MPLATPNEPKCRHIVFEALYVHGLGLSSDPELTRALAPAGFDTSTPEAEYALSTFGRCLEVTRRLRFSELAENEAYRVLGTRFISGILNTMLGKVVGVAVLVTGPDRTTKRIPSLMKSDYGVEVSTHAIAPRHYEVRSAGGQPPWTGHFFRGLFEEALRRTRVVPHSELRAGAELGSYVVELRWP